MNGCERDKRLRPERPKKENPDFDYEFSLVPENLVWIKEEQMPVVSLTQQSAVSFEKSDEGQGQVPQVANCNFVILVKCLQYILLIKYYISLFKLA